MVSNAGLYIHVPFCVKKCTYCDFYSIADLSLRDAFVDALIREMELLGSLPFAMDTIYLGGGTPSVLTAQAVDRLLSCAMHHFSIMNDAEITIEANPGTVDRDSLQNFRRSGINRINIGVQSFSTAGLLFLGRIHTAAQAEAAISQAREAGFDNLGLDLIFGLPGQSPGAWQEDLQRAVDFSPEHLSCYILTFEEATPLGIMKAKGRVKPPDDSDVAELFKITQIFLGEHGYEQYEIANYAKIPPDSNTRASRKTFRSRHNQKYWSSVPYIGLGPGAHSFVAPERHWNSADLQAYLSQLKKGVLPIEKSETLTRDQRLMESLYLGLRTVEGIDIPWLEKTFSLNFRTRYARPLQELSRQGLLTLTGNRCALTQKGMRFLDGIVGTLID